VKTLYIHEEAVHNLVAPREVVPIIISLTKPSSVLDVGCGIGTWLKTFEEYGISDYVGVDGDYVDVNLLKIPTAKFVAQDLRKEWSLGRSFDVAISLEVAEHLPEEDADQFIKALTSHSNTIIFSAAIPGQGGQNHLNEQWPEYWQEKFRRHGFYFHDVLRPIMWTNKKVDWWYKQNMFLIRKTPAQSFPFNSLSVVHPEVFLTHKQNEKQFYQSLLQGKQGIKLAVKIFVKAVTFKLKSFLNTVK
jgi:SAM-dependent methyltransferase